MTGTEIPHESASLACAEACKDPLNESLLRQYCNISNSDCYVN